VTTLATKKKAVATLSATLAGVTKTARITVKR
jgi:hypothetical protein